MSGGGMSNGYQNSFFSGTPFSGPKSYSAFPGRPQMADANMPRFGPDNFMDTGMPRFSGGYGTTPTLGMGQVQDANMPGPQMSPSAPGGPYGSMTNLFSNSLSGGYGQTPTQGLGQMQDNGMSGPNTAPMGGSPSGPMPTSTDLFSQQGAKNGPPPPPAYDPNAYTNDPNGGPGALISNAVAARFGFPTGNLQPNGQPAPAPAPKANPLATQNMLGDFRGANTWLYGPTPGMLFPQLQRPAGTPNNYGYMSQSNVWAPPPGTQR